MAGLFAKDSSDMTDHTLFLTQEKSQGSSHVPTPSDAVCAAPAVEFVLTEESIPQLIPTSQNIPQKELFRTHVQSLVTDTTLGLWIEASLQEREETDPIYLTHSANMCCLITTVELWKWLERVEQPPERAVVALQRYQKGLQLRALHRIIEAAEEFQKVVNAAPAWADAWYYLACSYDDRGWKSRAIPSYLRALDLELKDPVRHINALLFLSSSLVEVKHAHEAVPFLARIQQEELKTDFQRRLYGSLRERIPLCPDPS